MNRYFIVICTLLWGTSHARLASRILQDASLDSDAPSGTPFSLSTISPFTVAPTTLAPASLAPATATPISAAPITSAPITSAPITSAPISSAPITTAPITSAPTEAPFASPSDVPSVAPNSVPSATPTKSPTDTPVTVAPTITKSNLPSLVPTSKPSSTLTGTPTAFPFATPSGSPTGVPTLSPSDAPSGAPTSAPTETPSLAPSSVPSAGPTTTPSATPSLTPTSSPSTEPSSEPSLEPSSEPSLEPSSEPSSDPSSAPVKPPVVQVPSAVVVPAPTPSPLPVFPLPEIFIDAGIEEEDKPYISGNYWASYFDAEILGIPVEYQQVAEAFKSHRSGSNFRYTIPGLLAYASYEVTLGFAENYVDFCQVGSRQFNVTVNGKRFVNDLDVYDTVGCNTALVLKKSFRASPDGKIIIQFSPSPLKPMVAMIGINPNGPIKSLTLAKAVNQSAIAKLGFGSVIDLETVGTDELSIQANAISAVTRVRFRYNGIVHTEHVVPYAMNGGDGDHFFPVPYLAVNGNKTIWIDAFNDDKDQSDTIRVDLTVTGAEIFEQESDDTVVVLVPSILPSSAPSDTPSTIPSDVPSSQPSDVPSFLPSDVPSSLPSAVPSDVPSSEPSDTPSAIPSDATSAFLSDEPSGTPAAI